MFRRTRLWTMLVGLTVLGLVASACQQAPTGQPADQPDPDGELKTLLGSEPDTIDPQKESFVHEVGQTMLVFSALMSLAAEDLKPVPDQAKEYKVSQDGKVYTFTLKDTVKYSDGTPVKASNFVYAWKRLCDPETAGQYQELGEVVKGCHEFLSADPKKETPDKLKQLREGVSVRAVDDKTVEYTLAEPAPYFLSMAALWVGVPTREDLVKKGGDKWTEPETFIGNGPFKLVEWKHNEKMVYERVDGHEPKAKLKRITKSVVAESSVGFAAYRNDEIDIFGVSAENKKVVESDADMSKQVVKTGGTCTFYYGFNNEKPPFDDKNVRLAFAKSIDRQAYVNDIEAGIASVNQSFIPPGLPGYDDKDDQQKYDVAAAKQLLSGSKYASSMPEIKFTYGSSATAKKRVEWAVGQWKQNLGVNIALDPVDRRAFTQLVKDRKTTPQLFSLGWCADYPHAQNWMETAVQVSLGRLAWKNSEFQDIVKKANAESDFAKANDLYKQAQRVLIKDAPIAPFFSDVNWYLIKPWVKGYKLTVLDFTFGYYSPITDVYVTKRK